MNKFKNIVQIGRDKNSSAEYIKIELKKDIIYHPNKYSV